MLTLFTIPKSFHGHTAVIQRNAIQSWVRLHPACEVVLCGDEYGVKEAAEEFGVRFISDIARNDYGTPLISYAFERVERAARYPLLCYVNADIILLESFVAAVQSIPFREFLMVGQRWDIDISEPIDFSANGWQDRLKKHVAEKGSLHSPTGIDYFVFPRTIAWSLPPFAVGRPGWDNWLIHRARQIGLPVVDATRVVMVVHQNHDYRHVKQAVDQTWEGPEAARNRELIGDWGQMFTIRDATYSLRSDRALSAGGLLTARRNFRTLPVSLSREWKRFSYFLGAVFRVLRRCFSMGT